MPVRLPRSLLTTGAVATMALGPSLAIADSEVPAPERLDRSRVEAPSPKSSELWTAAAEESRVGSFGTFSDSIAIEVPAFRKITPDLSLTYRSSGGNGPVGVGWSLEGVGRIERASPGKGAPSYTASDIYLLDGEELVPCVSGSVSPSCTTGGTHSTKNESYLRIALSGAGTSSTWTVTAKDGTKSVYGSVLVGPGADGTSGSSDDQVFRWGLKQVVDTKSNVVTYSWGANLFGGLWEYLDTVTYNGTTVKLWYEARTDIEAAAIGGQIEKIYGRIKSIDVSVGGSRARAYKLTYGTSGATSRSLLTSVQQFGKNATLDASGNVTGGTSWPAVTAGYPATSLPAFVGGAVDTGMVDQEDARYLTLDINGDGKTDMLQVYRTCTIGCTDKAVGWISTGSSFTATPSVTLPVYDVNAQFFAMDVDGDGRDDLVSLTKNTSTAKWKRSIFLSNGNGFTAGTVDTAMAFKIFEDAVTSRFLPMDINADGKTDMLEIFESCGLFGCRYHRVAWLSTGSAFTMASDEGEMTIDRASTFLAVDMNGDGKSDFVEIEPVSASTADRRVWVSNGTAFTLAVEDSVPYQQDMRILPLDVNGDGKTDLVQLTAVFGGGGHRRRTWLSTGSSFVESSYVLVSGRDIGPNVRVVSGDVNGDGKDDLMWLDPKPFSVERVLFLSKGTDFVAGTVDTLGGNGGHRYFAADVDGDGREDMIELYDVGLSTARRAWLVGGPTPDLLTSLGTGLGGTTTVSYLPSTAWTNADNTAIVRTVSSITQTDGRGGSSTTTYAYSGGKLDALEQRFLGFAYQKETAPCIAGESACPYTERWFSQVKAATGKTTQVRERDGSGKLLRAQVIDYTLNGTTLPRTALPTGIWQYTYVNTGAGCPGVDCKRTYVGRTFNAYGEVTQEIDRGDYDVTGDEETITTTFVPNTPAFIVNLPADVKTYQGAGASGAVLKETLSYYDGATAWNAAPTAGLRTKTAQWLSSPSSFVASTTEYDAWGNVTATVSPLGARTDVVYDATYHRFATSVTNELDHVTTTAWDVVCGKPRQTTNVNGQSTTFTYDALCRLSQKTAPGGKTETHTWVSLGDAVNQYEQVERPAADGTASPWFSRRYFDGVNRTWRELTKGPDATTGNILVDTAYNARGERASVTAPYYVGASTYATTFGYDALDRPTTVTFPGGAQRTTSYGLWSVTATDELGHVKTDRYNARGLRVAHEEVIGGVTKTTSYLYDARQALQQTTDPSGNIVTYTTDSLGRRRSMVDPSSGTWTYEYDGASRLTAQVDSKSQRTAYGYDALDRKTQKTSRAGTAQAVTVTWEYDEPRVGFYNVGKLTTVTDPAGTKELDYDVAGRVVSTTRTIGGTSYMFQYGFDAGDRPKWTTYPDGDTLGTSAAPLTYDSAGRLKSIPGYVTAVAYNAAGDVSQLTNANGTTTTRTYAPTRGWLTGIATVAGSATTIQNLVYTRNNKGYLTQVTSPVANEGWTYGYDDLDRVTSATNASSATHNQTLTYDAIGNISTNSRRGTYTYGTRPHAATAAGSSSYSYDGAGLMSTAPNRTMTWDGDNRLATVTNGGVTSTFTYDADGERIQQVEGTTNRRYLGDDYEITALTTATKYISLGGSLVARKEGTAKTWIHTDHLGSVQAETGSTGAVVYRKQYRPYGEILSSSGSIDYEPRGFAGERLDASGLVYLHARYYDPALGRFLSPDLIVDGNDTVGLNRHAYVGNSPVNATDPTGLAAVRPHDPTAGMAKTKSRDAAPPPPPPPPRPPSYPQGSPSSSDVATGAPPSQAPMASPNANISRSRSAAANGEANVARSSASSSRSKSKVPTARAAARSRRDTTRNERAGARRTPSVRQNEVQLMSNGPFPANGPMGDDDIEDSVYEMWADYMRSLIGEEEWDRKYGDGS